MMFAQDIPQEAETTGNVCPASSPFHAYIHIYSTHGTTHTAHFVHTYIYTDTYTVNWTHILPITQYTGLSPELTTYRIYVLSH